MPSIRVLLSHFSSNVIPHEFSLNRKREDTALESHEQWSARRQAETLGSLIRGKDLIRVDRRLRRLRALG